MPESGGAVMNSDGARAMGAGPVGEVEDVPGRNRPRLPGEGQNVNVPGEETNIIVDG